MKLASTLLCTLALCLTSLACDADAPADDASGDDLVFRGECAKRPILIGRAPKYGFFSFSIPWDDDDGGGPLGPVSEEHLLEEIELQTDEVAIAVYRDDPELRRGCYIQCAESRRRWSGDLCVAERDYVTDEIQRIRGRDGRQGIRVEVEGEVGLACVCS